MQSFFIKSFRIISKFIGDSPPRPPPFYLWLYILLFPVRKYWVVAMLKVADYNQAAILVLLVKEQVKQAQGYAWHLPYCQW